MSSQREIWQEEHLKESTFTRIHSGKPSQPVIDFAQFLKDSGLVLNETKVLDIGCGKGRNTLYLASLGFQALGVDFIEEAVRVARVRVEQTQNSAQFEVVDLTKGWPYPDASFQAVIDCNATVDIPNPGRTMVVNEAYRVLSDGGYYLFYGVSYDSTKDMLPGPEPHSGYFPKTGKFEKRYTKDELMEAYKRFRVVSLEEIQGSDTIEGQVYTYPLWVAKFQK